MYLFFFKKKVEMILKELKKKSKEIRDGLLAKNGMIQLKFLDSLALAFALTLNLLLIFINRHVCWFSGWNFQL